MAEVTALNAPLALPRLTDIRHTEILDQYLALALQEDGAWTDVTSDILPRESMGQAKMFSKVEGIFSGGIIAERIFHLLDDSIQVKRLAHEGQEIKKGDLLLRAKGPLIGILAAERTALNFVQRMSGVATATRHMVDAVAGWKADLLDTRKTTPLWRALERHAVKCGGGKNHRFALDDMVMIKNNHADAVGGVARAIHLARAHKPHLHLAAEARTLEEAREAAEAGADVIMLDNMRLPQIRRAVQMINHRALVEVTGGVSLRNIASLASAGVDRISVGAITHSAPSLDISLHLE